MNLSHRCTIAQLSPEFLMPFCKASITWLHVASQVSYTSFPFEPCELLKSIAYLDDELDPFLLSDESEWDRLTEGIATSPLLEWPVFAFYFKNVKLSPAVIKKQGYKHFRTLLEENIHYISCIDEHFPEQLRHIHHPPLGLSYLGEWQKPEPHRSVSIIGSRRAHFENLDAAYQLGKLCGEREITVISGGAFGCDIAAHKGLLSSNQRDAYGIIVMAGGLKKLYPGQNRAVFSAFIARGYSIVSERLADAPYRPQDFPVRNRIISGLTQNIVVMQASHKSGAMLTAQLALDQGRDVAVFRAPNDVDYSSGSAQLAHDGAYAFSDVPTYVDEYFARIRL